MSLHSQCNCHRTPCEKTPLMKIWDVNSIDLSMEPGNLGVFEITSRINHACIPNARRLFTEAGNIVIFSSEDIKSGVEIEIDYVGAGRLPVPTRRELLLEKYGFRYQCRGCVKNTVLPFDVASKALGDIFRPVEVTASEILGEKNAEEVAAAAEVDSWNQALESHILQLDKYMTVIFKGDYIHGINRRDLIYERGTTKLRQWIKENNKFGVSEDVIQRFEIRTMQKAKLLVEAVFQKLKKAAVVA